MVKIILFDIRNPMLFSKLKNGNKNMTTPEIKLENFLQYFKARIDFVKETCLDRIEAIILLTSYLDSLGGYRYGGSGSKSRFFKILYVSNDQTKTWKKVSLILLRQYLEGKNHSFYSELISILNRLNARTSDFTNLNHNPDISYDELILECHKSLTSKEVKVVMGDIKRFQYSEILWNAYRNASVHETAIQMNEAVNIAEKEEPFYSNEHMLEENKIVRTMTRFSIPPLFLINTIESSLKILAEEYRSGVFELELSNTYDEPNQTKVYSEKKDVSCDIKYPRMITKPCRPLLTDIGYLLEQSKTSHVKFNETKLDEYRKRENAMARSAIVMSIFSLESLVNCLYEDFKEIDVWQIPLTIQKNTGSMSMSFDKLPLFEKIYLIPYLCSEDPHVFSKIFFTKGSIEMQKLKELIMIRNSFAHSSSGIRRIEITKRTDGDSLVNDDFEENFWQYTNIPRDIFIVGITDAEKAKVINQRIAEKLNLFLNGRIIKNKWLTSEIIEFDPKKKNPYFKS